MFEFDNLFVILSFFCYPFSMSLPLNQNLAGLLGTVSNFLNALQKEAASKFGLTGSEAEILVFIDEKGPRTVPQIARALGYSRQNVQVTVNNLLEKGLVLCLINPDHKTSPLFTPAEGGQTTAKAIGDWQKEGLDTLFGTLSLGEKVEIKRLLQKLI